MKIECPGCHLVGNIDDSRVPATGLAMICPKCQKHFTAEPPANGPEEQRAMLDTCPVCQYATFTEEKFAVCPKCGLDVAEHQKKQLEYRKPSAERQKSQPVRRHQDEPVVRMTEEQRHRDEDARRRFGLDRPPGTVEKDEPHVARPSMDAPLPVMLVGWGTVVVSLLLLVYSGAGFIEYSDKVKEAAAAVAANEVPQSPTVLFFGYLFAPSLFAVYAAAMALIGAQFLRMKKQFVRPLGIGAWIGVLLVVIMKLTDILLSFGRASSSASFSYYAMAIVGDLMMAALWIAPFLVLAEYLKSPLFEKVEDLFV
jgi:Na+/proline symporter